MVRYFNSAKATEVKQHQELNLKLIKSFLGLHLFYRIASKSL